MQSMHRERRAVRLTPGDGTVLARTLFPDNDNSHYVPYCLLEERLPMGCRVTTLLDRLSPQQFQMAILLAVGLDICQIADFFDTHEPAVRGVLCESLGRTGCRGPEELAAELIYEWENHLYDKRLGKELAHLQDSAKRMLARIAATNSTVDCTH